jgi:hypothetical protein
MRVSLNHARRVLGSGVGTATNDDEQLAPAIDLIAAYEVADERHRQESIAAGIPAHIDDELLDLTLVRKAEEALGEVC